MGWATTLALARAGASVIAIAARQYEEIESIASEVRGEFGDERVLPMQADVANPADAQRVVAMALSRWAASTF